MVTFIDASWKSPPLMVAPWLLSNSGIGGWGVQFKYGRWQLYTERIEHEQAWECRHSSPPSPYSIITLMLWYIKLPQKMLELEWKCIAFSSCQQYAHQDNQKSRDLWTQRHGYAYCFCQGVTTNTAAIHDESGTAVIWKIIDIDNHRHHHSCQWCSGFLISPSLKSRLLAFVAQFDSLMEDSNRPHCIGIGEAGKNVQRLVDKTGISSFVIALVQALIICTIKEYLPPLPNILTTLNAPVIKNDDSSSKII